jgi:hypothetical protein
MFVKIVVLFSSTMPLNCQTIVGDPFPESGQEVIGKRLIVAFDRNRLAYFNLKIDEIKDEVFHKYLGVVKENSIVISDYELKLKDWERLLITEKSGMQIPLNEVAKLKYVYDGIDRTWQDTC